MVSCVLSFPPPAPLPPSSQSKPLAEGTTESKLCNAASSSVFKFPLPVFPIRPGRFSPWHFTATDWNRSIHTDMAGRRNKPWREKNWYIYTIGFDCWFIGVADGRVGTLFAISERTCNETLDRWMRKEVYEYMLAIHTIPYNCMWCEHTPMEIHITQLTDINIALQILTKLVGYGWLAFSSLPKTDQEKVFLQIQLLQEPAESARWQLAGRTLIGHAMPCHCRAVPCHDVPPLVFVAHGQ